MQCWGTSCVDGWRPTSNIRQVFASVAVRRREYCICGPCGGSANSFLGFWSGKILATLSQMLHLFQKLTVRGMLGSVLRSQRVYRVYRRVSCPLLMSVMSCRASIFVWPASWELAKKIFSTAWEAYIRDSILGLEPDIPNLNMPTSQPRPQNQDATAKVRALVWIPSGPLLASGDEKDWKPSWFY